jgi:hypothetical protein
LPALLGDQSVRATTDPKNRPGDLRRHYRFGFGLSVAAASGSASGSAYEMSLCPNAVLLTVRTQVMVTVLVAYQLYLALSTEIVDETLKQIERVSSWPVQALNIGLFVLVLGICWLYLRSTRADLQKLQQINEDERKEYNASLKTMVTDMGKVIERNNVIFERIDKRLEHLEQPSIAKEHAG